MWSKVCFSSLLVWSRSAFNISAVIWYSPGAFPFLSILSAAFISCMVGVSTDISSSPTSSLSSRGGDFGLSLFNTSSKCSFYLASLYSWEVLHLYPLLRLFVCYPFSSAVLWCYTAPCVFRLLLHSALSRLSLLSISFCLLSHFSWWFCLSLSDLVLAIFALMCSLSFISFHVFSLIQG